ncbi:DEAD/DEAH box helicase [Prevotella copri]|uniref:DEAD/DEAH box helicase n=3 Tax=Pseudomonadati TaxID=3379134 RepID=A0AA43USN2_9BACT|nr:DEAD/DEAH box helicase family protein [Segatella copri]MCW4137633.1 DEAD/DEAH box helicase family protein [Segatella copri]MCW4143288.1 DEAD/DEAH box helicase family protein [Segatella copri]MCW4167873.1 DEAD/DEAH box helicase family protein [Segatella copri]MQN39857.1 DEAD/DEAH box helicase [Segatella copri]MQN64969.1 DEAD/DEAH box helicase [Segatella copri]
MMEKKLKDFQKATVEHIVNIFKSKKQRRVLLSDEVGLGKTIVSKGVIQAVGELSDEYGIWDDNTYRVVYICSNANIVKQNTENLGIEDVMNIDESRLSMQHFIVAKKVKELQKSKKSKPRILIPLTPGTSFNLQTSAGNMNERALMFAILSHLDDFKDHKTALKNRLNIYGANGDNWTDIIDKYEKDTKENVCTGYRENISKEVVNDDCYQEAKDLLLKAIALNDYNTTNKAITLFRIIFCKISMKELNPDLVIMDEFQRFSSLLDLEGNSEEAMLTRTFFGKEDGPFILLVSATPYKPFTTLEELNENKIDEQYQDFNKLADFLFDGREDIVFQQVWHDYSKELCHISSDNLDILIAKKNIAEDTMYEAMSRTERYRNSSQDDTYLKISTGDIASYCQMQEVLGECNKMSEGRFGVKTLPMEYAKSSPYLLSFMDKYKLKEKLAKAYTEHPWKIKQKQQYLIKKKNINTYERIPSCNAKLDKLSNILFGEKGEKHGEQLFWIPASHPYYKIPASNVFAKNQDFSKVLVFSAWEMVPRMIACMISYAIEQKSISHAFPSATYTNTKENSEKDALDKQEGEKAGTGRLRRESLELVTCCSDFLKDAYNPKAYLGNDLKEIKAGIKENFKNTSRFTLVEQPTTAKFLLEAIKLLDSNTEEKILISEDGLDTLVNMAIGSPGICFYRLLGNKDLAQEAATKICNNIFNRRYNAAVIDILYNKKSVQTYFKQVIDYCVMGNLQAVLDEFAYMIDERSNGERNVEMIQKRMIESFIDRNYQEIDTTESFGKEKKKKWRIRTHYAMPYGNIRMTDQATNRANDVRLAFNSPFRPFVLASTSVGQEGLDFHWYCRKIMHWNISSNPQDMEQREGRIDRYKSLFVRRNVAKFHPETYTWNEMFDLARTEAKDKGFCELVPYWSIPQDMLKSIAETDREYIESIVPLYPLSMDYDRYRHMKSVLRLYRLTMGQPRQEELLEFFKDMPAEDIDKLLFNLSPIKRKK